MDGKKLGTIVNRSLDPNDGEIHILDRQMRRVDTTRQLEPSLLSGITEVLIGNENETGFAIISEDSREYAVSWNYFPKMSWYYVKATPLENYFQEIDNMRTAITMTTLVIIGICILVIWIVSTGLYSPMVRLIKKVTGSNSYIKAVIQNGEIQIISEAFDAINRDRDKVSELLWNNEKTIRNAYVMKLMRGILTKNDHESVLVKLAEFGFVPKYPDYCIMHVSFDYYTDFCSKYSETDREVFFFAVENISDELLSREHIAISCRNQNNGLYMLVNMDAAISDRLIEVGHDIVETIGHNFDFTVSVSISQTFQRLSNVDCAFKEANDAMAERFILGTGMVITSSTDKKFNRSLIPPLNPDLIVSAVCNASTDISMLAESICDHIRRSGVINQTAILIWLLEFLKRAEQKISSKTGMEFFFISDDNELSMLTNPETIERLYLFLTSIFSKACVRFNQSSDKCNYYIKMAVEMIEKDYAKDISLETIAAKVGFTSSYFSTLFKQEMGETYINYLNKYRITRAKQMLKEKNTTVNNIAQMAGFSSSYSFIRTFKKYEGITPGEYKAML